MLETVKKLIADRKITDFLLTGDVDPDDEVIDFIYDLTLFAIQFDDKYLLFEAVEQYSKIYISEANALLFHDTKEDDFKKAFISLMNFLVINGEISNVRIEKIVLYNWNNDNKRIICDAVKIILSNGQDFFLDPCNFWGFTIGSELSEKNWIDNLQDERKLDCKITIIG